LASTNLTRAIFEEESPVLTRACTVNFRDHVEFFEAIAETGKKIASGDKEEIAYKSPFASITSVTYLLFDRITLNIFEILPTADIHVPYDFDSDYLEIEYAVDGCCAYQEDGHKGNIFPAKHLYLSPPSGSKGSVIFCKDQPSKTISFHATNTIMGDLLGELGKELWEETFRQEGFKKGKNYPAMATPPDIGNSFLSIINCHCPNRAKRLFFECKFREILTQIIVHKMPTEESILGDFENEQIKKIPGILIDRLNMPPSIEELARELSLNTTTMKRGFKEIFGRPVYTYHRDMCLERAAIMLLNTNKPIFEITVEVGYSGSGNFCNAFKKRYGISPSQYRQQNKLSGPKVFS
jgi:AraC-like DNA-binding protein